MKILNYVNKFTKRRKEREKMDKLYGYKEKDIEGLVKLLDERKGETLSKVFTEYAKISGKSKGTVRNMYYALVKKCNEDKNYLDKYSVNMNLSAQKIVGFDDEQERTLVKSILLGKRQGRSARNVILELSGGNEKKALRFQNKYRNVVKNKEYLIKEIISEIRRENGETFDFEYQVKPSVKVPDYHLKKLQNEINGLIERVTERLQRENAYLKGRIGELEVENIKLKTLLYGGEVKTKTADFFCNLKEKDLPN